MDIIAFTYRHDIKSIGLEIIRCNNRSIRSCYNILSHVFSFSEREYRTYYDTKEEQTIDYKDLKQKINRNRFIECLNYRYFEIIFQFLQLY